LAKNIDPSERLFNLTCALVFTQTGLTKQEIFSSVQGYKETYDRDDAKKLAAMDKLFERDKTELKRSGVLVEGSSPPEAQDNNQEFRYSIPKDSYVWPKNLKLTAKQVALLNLAGQVWAKASISTEVNRAVMRLRALGDAPEQSELAGVAPRIRTYHSTFTPLSLAIESSDVVSFDYRKAGSDLIETRTVQPWLLRSVSGQWMLVSWDEDRDAPRNFLLKRIVNAKVDLIGRTFSKPTKEQLRDAEIELDELISEQIATLRIKPDTGAWRYFEMDLPGIAENEDEISIHFMDLDLLASELRSFGTDLQVIRPASLAQSLRAGLEKVVNEHHA